MKTSKRKPPSIRFLTESENAKLWVDAFKMAGASPTSMQKHIRALAKYIAEDSSNRIVTGRRR